MAAGRPRTGSSGRQLGDPLPCGPGPSMSRCGSGTATSIRRQGFRPASIPALAWVEEDCGAGLAHEAARELVLFLRRPGGQPAAAQPGSSRNSPAEGVDVSTLHVPAGHDLGGKGPGEIALSVVAEIVAESYGRAGGPMRG